VAYQINPALNAPESRRKHMKYVKMLGLAAVAAAALMAFVGASTASATVLCKTPGTGEPTGTTCPAGWAYEKGTAIHAVNEGTATLTTSFLDITCNKSTVQGSTDNEGSASETVTGSITTLTFEECNCEVKVLAAGTLEVHWISGTHNGTLTSKNAEVTATCSTIFGKVHCIYSTPATGTDLGTATGGNPATMDISSADIPRLSTNSLCDTTANWDANYSVTSPAPLYVTGHT
jgi:hypothetical protein